MGVGSFVAAVVGLGQSSERSGRIEAGKRFVVLLKAIAVAGRKQASMFADYILQRRRSVAGCIGTGMKLVVEVVVLGFEVLWMSILVVGL